MVIVVSSLYLLSNRDVSCAKYKMSSMYLFVFMSLHKTVSLVLPPLIQKLYGAALHENVILLLYHQRMLRLIQGIINMYVIRVMPVIDLESLCSAESIESVF